MRKATFTNSQGSSVEFYVSPFFVESIDGVDSAEVDIQTQKAPFQNGATLIDALLEPRTITVTGRILSLRDGTETSSNRRELVSVLNPLLLEGDLVLERAGFSKTIKAVPRTSPKFKPFSWEDHWLSFQVSFYCADPLFKDLTETDVSLSVVASVFSIPFSFPTTFSTVGDGTIEIVNTGDTSTGLELVINGPCENPVVTNEDTGEYIKVNTTIDYGETLTINTKAGEKSVTFSDGITESNYFQYLDFNSVFFSLATGSNILSITDDNGFFDGFCTVKYTNKFLGM